MDWFLPLLAALLVLSGTGLGLYITFKFRDQVNKKQKQIEQLNRQINDIVKTNNDLGEKILEISNNLNETSKTVHDLAQKNIDLTDKNLSMTNKSIELSKLIKNIQTGGDSYPVVEIFHTQGANFLELQIINRGKFVIRSANVKVEDFVLRNYLTKKIQSRENVVQDIINPSISNHNLGSLFPSVFHKFKVINFNQNIVFLKIQVFTENGVFYQTTKWVDALGNRKCATIVENEKKEIVYKNSSPDFPVNDDGSLDMSFKGI